MIDRRNIAFLAAGLMFVFAMTAQAAIITPTAATATSSISTDRNLTETINGDGLSGGGTSGDILAETHASTGGTTDYWLGTKSVTQVLDFDLGDATNVEAVHIWNYDRGSDDGTSGVWDKRAIASFDIAFSTNGGANYSTPISITGLLGFNDIDPPIAVQTFTFAAQTGVTDIQITNLQNFGDGSWYGLGEIRFDTVPEPATLSLLVIGAIGLARRRRK